MKIIPGAAIPTKKPGPIDPIMKGAYPREDPAIIGNRRVPGWRTQVEQYFQRAGGWKMYHTQDSRGSKRGFPDLVFVCEYTGRTIFAEIKTETGEVTIDQIAWLSVLAVANEVYVWRPSDADEILAILQEVNDTRFHGTT